jgi:hypothetical protein
MSEEDTKDTNKCDTGECCQKGAAVMEKVTSGRGRRGRKPAKYDNKVRLERSQQSARECRARKKLRYQYLEELVANREKAIILLRKELDVYKKYCRDMDEGVVPKELLEQVKTEPAV